MPTMTNFHGLIPAMAVPFRADHSIDEQELASFARWLAAQPGIVGMMTNGHTGEVFSLTPRERAVLERLVLGEPNKQIAAVLGVSEKTVKVHRANVLLKMAARSIASLVRMTERAGRRPAETKPSA